MTISGFGGYVLTSCAAVAALAGCGGQSRVAPTGGVPQPLAVTTATREKSWMLSEAKSENLLYVTSIVSSYVFVFSYPAGKLVGTLGGVNYAATGECSDKQGNVFVVGVQEVVEYAHGGSNPIGTLQSDNYPNGCAVDPVSGNLAVAGGSPHDFEANVAIFPNEKGPPTLYYNAAAPAFDFCTYDDRGNLFVNEYGSPEFGLDELANGSSALTRINISQTSQTISAGGAVQWNGTYLVLGDPHGNGQGRHGPTTIYQVAVSGSTGRVVKTIELFSGKAEHGKPDRNPGTPVEFWIQGKTIVNPLRYHRDVAFWRYPSGGYPTKKILGVLLPYGVTVSLAPK
jgi:hypothetical protein